MLPGIAMFCFWTLCSSLYNGVFFYKILATYIFQLTMLPDILCFWIPPSPGIYWYFGLTMEFYIVYAFLIHKRPDRWMWAILIFSISLQFITDPTSAFMQWERHNVTGWASVLIMGIVCARRPDIFRKKFGTICLICSLLLFIPSMFNPFTWQFSILACVVFAIALAKWSLRIPVWRSAWIWVGRLSPMLFVAHPFTRYVLIKFFTPGINSPFPLIIYLCLTFLLAIGLKYVTKVSFRKFQVSNRLIAN